jgi:hypothetical protein
VIQSLTRHAELLLRVLLEDPERASFDGADWDLVVRIARRHTVLVRVTERLRSLGVVPPALVAAADQERSRGGAMLQVLRHMQGNALRHRIGWVAPKALYRFPDVGDDVDILLFSEDRASAERILDGLAITREASNFSRRVAANTVYAVATPAGSLAFDLRHGRIGSAGQHAAFARTLGSRVQSVTLDGANLPGLTREDQLVLQGLEKIAGRRSFHLCDVHQTIEILRTPALNWDYVLATARTHGGWEGLGCYLSYVDDIHRRLLGCPLSLPSESLRHALARAGGGRGQLAIREKGFYFPVRITGRIRGRQLGRSLLRKDWDAALRLTAWPIAALAERALPLMRRGTGE